MSIPIPNRKFVLKNNFEKFSSIVEREKRYGPSEIHFDIPWRIKIQRCGFQFAAFLCCRKSDQTENIQVDFEIKLISVHGIEKTKKTSFRISDLKDGNDGYGWDFMNWENVEDQFMLNDSISIECHVELKKIRRPSFRRFDEIQDMSDGILIVENQKFYISKLFLAFQSSYFRSLFMGNFMESTKSEIVLNDVDAVTFQFYLELLHGESSITKNNIENMLHLADMFDTPTATRRCEEFLIIFPHDIKLKEKLRLAVQYKLSTLREKCLKEVKTIADIPDILPIPLTELNVRTAISMLRRM